MARRGLAVDSNENIYINWGEINGGINHFGWYVKFSSATGKEVGRVDVYPNGCDAFAVDPSTNNIVVDRGNSIVVFGPFGEPYETPPLETFPTEGFSESYGLGVNGAGTVYASERGADKIKTFDYLPEPTRGHGNTDERVGNSDDVAGDGQP